MFSSANAIWRFAHTADELDDWLPYAEDLTKKWANQNKGAVQFLSTFEIILASLLLEDDLLPASARVAFAKVMLEIVDEATTNKYQVKCLHITPLKPGRKKNSDEVFFIVHEVRSLMKDGATATQAYEAVANKRFKSPDTIRRAYERSIKEVSRHKERGEIKI